jgi:RimJ/RimL family protein N-acetyltransferase
MPAYDRGVDGRRVRIEPWGEGDLALLHRTLGDPDMTKYVGGPESDEKLAERQARFERLPETGTGQMFKILDERTGEPAGSIGYWDQTVHDEPVYEMGWFVVPEFQGRGVASAAGAQVIERLRAERRHASVHAFPSIDNDASNALCRKLGFTLVEEVDFEYPPGHVMRGNDWRLDLTEDA